MNWAQFKNPVPHMCLAGAVVACWFVTQEVAGLNTHFLQKYFSSSTDSVDSTELIIIIIIYFVYRNYMFELVYSIRDALCDFTTVIYW